MVMYSEEGVKLFRDNKEAIAIALTDWILDLWALTRLITRLLEKGNTLEEINKARLYTHQLHRAGRVYFHGLLAPRCFLQCTRTRAIAIIIAPGAAVGQLLCIPQYEGKQSFHLQRVLVLVEICKYDQLRLTRIHVILDKR